MVSEFEIWRAATLLIGQYGESASDHAEQRAKALEAKADLDGWARWMRIAAAILELSNQEKGG
jgi:hypothetical protein